MEKPYKELALIMTFNRGEEEEGGEISASAAREPHLHEKFSLGLFLINSVDIIFISFPSVELVKLGRIIKYKRSKCVLERTY